MDLPGAELETFRCCRSFCGQRNSWPAHGSGGILAGMRVIRCARWGIIGALFLKRFVTQTTDWVHIDLFAWNPKERPGRPVGGEAHAVRALQAMLTERYAGKA